MKKHLAFLILFFSLNVEARIYVPIDQPSDKKLPIAITELVPLDGGAGRYEKEIPEIIQHDLEISAYFQFISPEAFLEPKNANTLTTETIHFDLWSAIEAQGLIKGGIKKEGDRLTVQLKLFDPFLKQMLVGKQYVGITKDFRSIAHRFSDEVMLALTGTKGPFNSKITYSVPTKKFYKAIYVMDYDGANNYEISNRKALSLGSKFSPDGNKLVYTMMTGKSWEIFMANAGGGGVKQLTRNGATNITPAFTPDGGSIIFSSTMKGDADLFLMNLGGNLIGQVTDTSGIDVSPMYSPNGGQIVFSSDRFGKLHVFTINAGGGGDTRLTFVGQFNDTPAWSPDGQKIAFCGRDAGAFDIFTMNSDGSLIQRLTAGEGNNEHPSFSADSRYITFHSTRGGGSAIYVMRFDGANPVRVSKESGMLPWWGPSLK